MADSEYDTTAGEESLQETGEESMQEDDNDNTQEIGNTEELFKNTPEAEDASMSEGGDMSVSTAAEDSEAPGDETDGESEAEVRRPAPAPQAAAPAPAGKNKVMLPKAAARNNVIQESDEEEGSAMDLSESSGEEDDAGSGSDEEDDGLGERPPPPPVIRRPGKAKEAEVGRAVSGKTKEPEPKKTVAVASKEAAKAAAASKAAQAKPAGSSKSRPEAPPAKKATRPPSPRPRDLSPEVRPPAREPGNPSGKSGGKRMQIPTIGKRGRVSMSKTHKNPESESKKRKKNKPDTYAKYIYKTFRGIFPVNVPEGEKVYTLSTSTMGIMNSLMNDVFERITIEAARLARLNKSKTLGSREIRTATLLIFRGQLAKHGVAEGDKALKLYMISQAESKAHKENIPKRF